MDKGDYIMAEKKMAETRQALVGADAMDAAIDAARTSFYRSLGHPETVPVLGAHVRSLLEAKRQMLHQALTAARWSAKDLTDIARRHRGETVEHLKGIDQQMAPGLE